MPGIPCTPWVYAGYPLYTWGYGRVYPCTPVGMVGYTPVHPGYMGGLPLYTPGIWEVYPLYTRGLGEVSLCTPVIQGGMLGSVHPGIQGGMLGSVHPGIYALPITPWVHPPWYTYLHHGYVQCSGWSVQRLWAQSRD